MQIITDITNPDIILNQYNELYSFFDISCLWSTADEIPISINISVNEITKTAMAISPKSSFLKNLVRIDICPNLAHAFTTALSEVHLTPFIALPVLTETIRNLILSNNINVP